MDEEDEEEDAERGGEDGGGRGESGEDGGLSMVGKEVDALIECTEGKESNRSGRVESQRRDAFQDHDGGMGCVGGGWGGSEAG